MITADTPATRELLIDGESALLVPPGDAGALANALRQLSTDEELRTAIAARGYRVYVERASRRVLGEEWRSALKGSALDSA